MINPYANVNWPAAQHIKSFSHMHATTQSFFNLAVQDGYQHFAISNYVPSEPIYPLADRFTNIPSGIVGSPNSEKTNTTNNGGHFNALGSFAVGHGQDEDSVAVTWQQAFDEILSQLQFPDGGGITLNHPDDHNLSLRCNMLDYDERVLGIEIYNRVIDVNKGNPNYLTNSLAFWDKILRTGRRCWGFCVVDWQIEKYAPHYGSNILLVPDLTEQDCLRAYRSGAFYSQIMDNGLRFNRIDVSDSAVNVSVNKPATINVVTDVGVVATSQGTECSYIIKNKDIFVRVEAVEDGVEDSHIFSNPIMLKSVNDLAKENEGIVAKKKRIKKFLIISG